MLVKFEIAAKDGATVRHFKNHYRRLFFYD